MIKLGVNIDHVATLREARGGVSPDPVHAAFAAIEGGADGITIHLREDRRAHIGDRDLRLLLELSAVPLNLEMALTPEMIGIACKGKGRPASVCLVPEKRAERTTEGGLDADSGCRKIAAAVKKFHAAGILVSLFIEPDPAQIDAAITSRADMVEFHTGRYSLTTGEPRDQERLRILRGIERARAGGLVANAGHGLNYLNTQAIAALPGLYELNIGHAIIARAVFTGLSTAVAEMKRLMCEAERG